MRRDGAQLLLHGIAHGQCVNKRMDRLLGHRLVGARQCLQRLVRLRIALSAQDGLNALGNDRPTVLQVAVQSALVEQQFAQALQKALESDLNMRQRHTHVAQHRRVSQVALQA